jgi:hypothetical protein
MSAWATTQSDRNRSSRLRRRRCARVSGPPDVRGVGASERDGAQIVEIQRRVVRG